MVKKNSCVFISGAGTNLKALIHNSRQYNFPVNIKLVVTNKKNAKGLKYAKSQFFLAKKPDPRGGRSMSDFGKTRIHGHVFFENETFFSWISLPSWLFILIFRARSATKYQILTKLQISENPSFRKFLWYL